MTAYPFFFFMITSLVRGCVILRWKGMHLKDDLPPKIRLSFIRNVRLQKMQNALKDSII